MIIQLTQGLTTQIDDGDWQKIKGFKWHAWWSGNKWYARACSKGAIFYLHRLIMDARPGNHIDHKSGDGLDNRKANLRPCTMSQNIANQGPQRGRKYKGAYFHSASGKFLSQIKANSKLKYLGLYATEEEAALAYNKAASELFGEFAVLNEIRQ